MTESGEHLVPISEAEAAIEHYKAGGLISHVQGAPERTMDGLIQRHLERTALLQARGDTALERPMYVFNPDNRLLINYSLRRDYNKERAGLFAEIVELDDIGRPRHGVSVTNPFETTTGFIPVAVGENTHGAAPSFVDLTHDSDSPLDRVPPNVALADLMIMLTAEPISNTEDLKTFLDRHNQLREEQRAKVQASYSKNYRGTLQGLGKQTNPLVNWIVSDRDVTPLVEASRQIGLFPIVTTMERFITAARDLNKLGAEKFDIRSGAWTSGTGFYEQKDNIPGFITYDYQYDRVDRLVPNIRYAKSATNHRRYIAETILDELIEESAVFATLKNPGWNDELGNEEHPMTSEDIEMSLTYDRIIQKRKHGLYEQLIRPADAGNVQSYADWLRKVRLDYAVTLYLRGLSQV